MLLQGAGLKHVRQKALTEHKTIIQQAFREFINQQILSRLSISTQEKTKPDIVPAPIELTSAAPAAEGSAIVTTERELEVFRWIQQRLAFLARDENLFAEIRHISYRDFQGKFAVYYKWERKGRLFDLVENRGDAMSSRFRFRFPDDVPNLPKELVTDQLLEIDQPLLTVFKARVGAPTRGEGKPQA